MKWMLSCLVIVFGLQKTPAQDSTLKIRAGVCVNKMVGFYWMNGFSAEINSKKILKGKIDLGINITSSSLGSAFLSNAIPVHAAEVYLQRCYRKDKHFKPLTSLSIGYAQAFYGNKEFDNLTRSTMLISPEFGMRYVFNKPLMINISLGYNLISGNGMKGAGFIYPIYFRFKVLYIFGNK